MDSNDLDDLFDPESEGDGELEPPDLRATIRDNEVLLVAWAPHLLSGGPNREILQARAEAGVSVADLWIPRTEHRELIAEYLVVADRRRADRVLSRWAEAVGYSRLWLPDRLITFDTDRPLGSARVECHTCGAVWQDSGPNFWSRVREAGTFPTLCPICNGDLPQWNWRARRSRPKTLRSSAKPS